MNDEDRYNRRRCDDPLTVTVTKCGPFAGEVAEVFVAPAPEEALPADDFGQSIAHRNHWAPNIVIRIGNDHFAVIGG
jgi:hypothetical protein